MAEQATIPLASSVEKVIEFLAAADPRLRVKRTREILSSALRASSVKFLVGACAVDGRKTLSRVLDHEYSMLIELNFGQHSEPAELA